jgi:hypothetical protein
MRTLFLRLAPVVSLVLGLVPIGLGMSGPRPARPVAVLFPPWWSAERSVAAAARAELAILRFGGLPGIVVLAPLTPFAAARLRQAGAWLVLDAEAGSGCAPSLP